MTRSAGFAVWWEHENASRGSSLKWYLIHLCTNILLYTSLLSKACDNIPSTAFDYNIEVILSEHKRPSLYWCKKKIRIEACAVEHKIERDFLTPEVTKKDVSTSVLPSSGCYGLYLVPFLGCETGQEGFTDVQLQPGGLAKAQSPLPCGMLPWEWQRYSLDISYDLCALLLWSFDSNC